MLNMIRQFTFHKPREIIQPTLWLFLSQACSMLPAILAYMAIYILGEAFVPPYTLNLTRLITLAALGVCLLYTSDVVVIGGGPVGLTAALYLARARYRVIVVEKEHFGGKISITDEVVNFPEVERTSGKALTETMRRQAQSFGAEFLLAEVTGLVMDGDVKTVQTSRGELHCFGVLLATGAHPRSVGFAGEAEFKGRGVAYCATCDGEFFTGKEVFVVGGGFAAARCV